MGCISNKDGQSPFRFLGTGKSRIDWPGHGLDDGMIKAITVRVILCFAAVGLGAFAFAEDTSKPPDGARWYEITGNGVTSGTPCLVRSIETNEVIGQVEAGYHFLAFRKDDKTITLAYNGKIGYVPAAAASELFPGSAPQGTQFKAAGTTLEDLAKQQRDRSASARKGSLAPKFTNQPTPTPTPAADTGKGGRGSRGGGVAARGGAGAL